MSDQEKAREYKGHPLFHHLSDQEKEIHDAKNHDYAAGGHPLGNFLRVSAIMRMYPGLDLSDPAVVAMVYLIKQFDAYLWIKSSKHEPKVEGVFPRLQDMSVYSKLIQCIEWEKQQALKQSEGTVAERAPKPPTLKLV